MVKALTLATILLLVSGCFSSNETSHRIGPSKETSICPETVCQIPKEQCAWQVKFSPNGGAEKQIVEEILRSKNSLYVMAYSFTSDPIVEALVFARSNGVDVQVILDRSNKQGKGSDLTTLLRSRITTYIDNKHAIAHNKYIITDNRKVLTGSFNFTAAAEHRNAENSLLLDCPKLAAEYVSDWNKHKEHSQKLDFMD